MIPSVSPVTSTLLFFIAAAIIGTNGGELMNVTDEMTIVSASILNNLASNAWMHNDPNTTNTENVDEIHSYIIAVFEVVDWFYK